MRHLPDAVSPRRQLSTFSCLDKAVSVQSLEELVAKDPDAPRVSRGERLTVAAVIDTSTVSGPGRQLAALACEFRQRDVDLHVITFQRVGRPTSPFPALLKRLDVAHTVLDESGPTDFALQSTGPVPSASSSAPAAPITFPCTAPTNARTQSRGTRQWPVVSATILPLLRRIPSAQRSGVRVPAGYRTRVRCPAVFSTASAVPSAEASTTITSAFVPSSAKSNACRQACIDRTASTHATTTEIVGGSASKRAFTSLRLRGRVFAAR